MSKEMGVILLGVWVVVVPYLGLPTSWKTILIVLSGIGIVALGLLIRGETLSRRSVHRHDPFIENTPSPLNEDRA